MEGKMTYPIINIYVDMNSAQLSEAVKGARLPENVRAVFPEVTQGFEEGLAENSVNIVITDNDNRAGKLSELKRRALYIVFAGSRKLSDGLEDVWRTDDPDEFRLRFEHLIEKIVLELRAWFFEHTLKTVMDTVPDMVWIKDMKGIHTEVNEAFAKAVHKSPDEVKGKDIITIWDIPRTAEDSVAVLALAEENAVNTGKKCICDEAMITGTGVRHITAYTSPLYDMTGNVIGTVGVGHDITDFSNYGKELSIIMEHFPFPMGLFTSDMKTVWMNGEFINAAGITPAEAASFDFDEWEQNNLVPLQKAETDNVRHLSKQECRLHRGNLDTYYNLRKQEIRDPYDNISGYILIMTNISYLREYENAILNTANTDMLTGMFNRRYFYNYLNDHAEKPFTLFYMDLDGFKYVNDRYGHSRGDDVLAVTSKVIKTRVPNAVSARIGGDEFAIAVDGILEEEEIRQYSHNIESTIQRIFMTDGLPVTISIGAAVYDGKDITIDELMRLADQRMYEVKKTHHSDDYE